MKKRSTANLTLVVLLLVILSLIGVSGTYAKYTTTVTGTGTAIVAKWNFKVGNTQTDTFTVNLAENATGVLVGGVKKILPGSTGTFPITVTNNGDVEAELTVEVDKSAAEGKFTKGQFTFGDPVKTGTTEKVEKVGKGETVTVDVPFTWTFEVDDATNEEDTSIGENASADAITLVTVKVTGTQVAAQ